MSLGVLFGADVFVSFRHERALGDSRDFLGGHGPRHAHVTKLIVNVVLLIRIHVFWILRVLLKTLHGPPEVRLVVEDPEHRMLADDLSGLRIDLFLDSQTLVDLHLSLNTVVVGSEEEDAFIRHVLLNRRPPRLSHTVLWSGVPNRRIGHAILNLL